MRPKLIPLVVSLLQLLSAQTLTTHGYGGSGSDAANAIATDSTGNIYVAGTTTSFDLPLLNPAQSANSGTQLLYSTNAGFTWKPLGNLPDAYSPYQLSQMMPIAVDPTNPEIFYLASNGVIFKTTDGGQHFSSTRLLPAGYTDITIVIDPSNPSTLYATVPTPGGVFKSTDAGVTWSGAVLGLPADSIGPIVIDPFHHQTLWLDVNGLGFVSTNGANSWSPAPLPKSAEGGLMQFVFDLVKPDTLYAIGQDNGGGPPNLPLYFLKSTDGGKNWSPLVVPFQRLGLLVADPVRAGRLYLLSAPNLFYRSTDGGVSWQSFPFPNQYASAMVVDPGNPNIILAGSYRSNNGGETWSPTMPSRDIQMVFAPTGRDLVYASGPLTSDAFLAKFKPDGKTLEFATYFGGMGNETASSVQLDASGNIWIAGTKLNVSPKPAALDLTRALNAFSLLPGPIAAGEIVELTVPNFKPAQSINIGINLRLPLGTTLGNTQVLFNGKPVPMMSVATGKIECIAPQDFETNTSTSIQVNANGTLSNPLQEDVAPTALGLLSADGSGTGLANARNQDGTLNSPSNPAKPGSSVTVFFTGAGSPPDAVTTQYGGTVNVAPLHGFVPGIYSATFEIPSNANAVSSPLSDALYAPGGSILVPGSTSQYLLIYVK